MNHDIQLPVETTPSTSNEKVWVYGVRDGYHAEIEDGKIVVRKDGPKLNEFESGLRDIITDAINTVAIDDDTVIMMARDIINLAGREIERQCTAGGKDSTYWYRAAIVKAIEYGEKKGAEEERKRASQASEFHYQAYEPPCYHGGPCTNPHHDCINCPRLNVMGGYTTANTKPLTHD